MSLDTTKLLKKVTYNGISFPIYNQGGFTDVKLLEDGSYSISITTVV